jgi:hypothetical protein
MRALPFIAVLLGTLLVVAYPASATRSDGGYIDDKLQEWIEYAEDLDYRVIETQIDSIRTTRSYQFDLDPGTYHAFAEGDRNIVDLDMVAYDDYGFELGSDYMSDNFPYVTFELDSYEEVEFIITAYSFESMRDRGDFCFVLAREGDWRDDDYDRDRNRDRRDRDRGDGRDDRRHRDYRDDRDDRGNRDDQYWRDWSDNWTIDWDYDWRYDSGGDWGSGECRDYVEDRLGELRDYAWYMNMDEVMDDVGQIEDTESYEVTLDRGTYVAFAAGGPWIDDLDLHVYDPWGEVIAEDIEMDDAPAVWFRLEHRMTVEIEVEVFEFGDNHDSGYFCLLLCRDR